MTPKHFMPLMPLLFISFHMGGFRLVWVWVDGLVGVGALLLLLVEFMSGGWLSVRVFLVYMCVSLYVYNVCECIFL